MKHVEKYGYVTFIYCESENSVVFKYVLYMTASVIEGRDIINCKQNRREAELSCQRWISVTVAQLLHLKRLAMDE